MDGQNRGDTKPPRPLSRYAQKLADEASGKREPFPFVDKFHAPKPKPKPAQKKPREPEPANGIATATVTVIFPQKGYAFLHEEEEDGRKFFLHFNVVEKGCPAVRLEIGDIIVCEYIPPLPRKNHPRVTKILSHTPAPRAGS